MRRGWAIAIIGAAAGTAGAWATPRAAAPLPDQIVAAQRRLILAKQQSAAAAARSRQLDRAAASEQDAAAKARSQEAAVSARIEQAQADIAAARTRIALVQTLLDDQRAGLARRQGPIVRLLAALQSFARRPAVVAIVQPGSVDDLVHVRAVLGTVTPVIAARTAGLRGALDRTQALRASAALAVKSLTDSRAALDTQRRALAGLEQRHRARSVALNRRALHESDRAIAMGEQARDIVDRMGELGNEADTRAALVALPGPVPRPGDAFAVPGARAWAKGDAPYRLPVSGRLVTGLGEVSSAGVSSRGLTLAVASGSAVIAPAAGRVAYAKVFRDYGPVVIIDHGDGWTSLILGLSSASVRRGETVAQGAAIGRAATGAAPRVTVELRRRGLPVDMIPLLG